MARIVENTQRDPRTFAIIGAAMEVHRELGSGFLEAVYQQSLAVEFQSRNVPAIEQCERPVMYKGQTLVAAYRADFICYEAVIVEIKAISDLTTAHSAQIINYLKATGFETGVLLNFGSPSREYKRFIHTSKSS